MNLSIFRRDMTNRFYDDSISSLRAPSARNRLSVLRKSGIYHLRLEAASYCAAASFLFFSIAAASAAEEQDQIVIEAAWSQDPGAKCVDDPDALDGKALYFPVSDQAYLRWYSVGSDPAVTAGEYEIRFRLKVADNKDGNAVFHAYGGDTHFEIKGTAFNAPKSYQEFTIPFATAPGKWKTGLRCNLRKLAGQEAWVDRITVVCKRRLTEGEVLAAGGFKRPSEPKLTPHEGLRVWFVKGLYFEHYRILEALKAMDAKIDFAWTPRPPSGLDGMSIDGSIKAPTGEAAKAKAKEDAKAEAKKAKATTDDKIADLLDGGEKEDSLDIESEEAKAAKQANSELEKNYAHAMSYDLIALCNVEADNLSLQARAMIQDAVKAGAGLLLVGGPFAFGRGRWQESEMLSEILPIIPKGDRDLQSLSNFTTLSVRKDGPLADIFNDDKTPAVRWIHLGRPKPGTTVELSADNVPVLVTLNYGKGKIALLAGTVLGEPRDGQVAFWDWPRWPELMNTVVLQLLPAGKLQ